MAVFNKASVPEPSLDQICSRLWCQGVTQAGCAPSVLSSLLSFGSSASTWAASLYRAAAMLPSPSRHICLIPASPCFRPLLPCITITQRQRNVLAAGQAGRLRVARTSAGHSVRSAHGVWMPHKARSCELLSKLPDRSRSRTALGSKSLLPFWLRAAANLHNSRLPPSAGL